ncbi:MAG: hypothetical protein Q4E09_05990 [Eubacteriales bacterium]|nr:hypothetical protein [Eubacteriales bacterium]
MVIERIIYEHLSKIMMVPVFTEEPQEKPNEYVLFEKVGGNERDYLRSATFTFQSFSTSLFGASCLNEITKDAVKGLVKCPEIAGVKLNSDYNFTDLDMKRYRYQAIFDITHY